MKSRFKQLISSCAVALTATALCVAQAAPGKKAMMSHGKVEAVNDTAKTLKVNGEKVEGWMDAMTMTYKVDKQDVLKMVKVGDQIMANVYEGDKKLHNVMAMPMGHSDKPQK